MFLLLQLANLLVMRPCFCFEREKPSVLPIVVTYFIVELMLCDVFPLMCGYVIVREPEMSKFSWWETL